MEQHPELDFLGEEEKTNQVLVDSGLEDRDVVVNFGPETTENSTYQMNKKYKSNQCNHLIG